MHMSMYYMTATRRHEGAPDATGDDLVVAGASTGRKELEALQFASQVAEKAVHVARIGSEVVVGRQVQLVRVEGVA